MALIPSVENVPAVIDNAKTALRRMHSMADLDRAAKQCRRFAVWLDTETVGNTASVLRLLALRKLLQQARKEFHISMCARRDALKRRY